MIKQCVDFLVLWHQLSNESRHPVYLGLEQERMWQEALRQPKQWHFVMQPVLIIGGTGTGDTQPMPAVRGG